MRVPGEGPTPCFLAIVGSRPGYWEDRRGRPFVGQTGEEVERYLDGISLPTREDVWLTNLHRDYKGLDGDYTKAETAVDTQELLAELTRVTPEIIVTLGAEAVRVFLGDVDLESVHAIPWQLDTRVILPLYHPAQGLYSPDIQGYVSYGFGQLAQYLAGNVEARVFGEDRYANKEIYEEITTGRQLQSRLQRLSKDATLAIDTEGWPSNPWSLQFSYRAGCAYLIRAHRQDLLDAFARIVCQTRPRLAFHSALHDLGMVRALALTGLDTLSFDDTRVMSYLLQVEPQGLKPLCVRHCGMQMQSYDDVMGDASLRLAVDYLVSLLDVETADYDEQCFTALCRELDSGRRVTKVPQLPKTPLHKAVIRCLRSPRARGLWEDQSEDIQVEGYTRLGAMPAPTLDHIPFDTARTYACRDADGTRRLLPELRTRIDANGLRDVYELELGTYPFIARMQQIGIRPDLVVFARLSDQLGDELALLQTRLDAETQHPGFNANSGDQVAVHLFETLGLDEVTRTSGGRGSTNDKILEGLEHGYPEYPVIQIIREYRELYKLKNTFVDRLPDFVQRFPFDGRVHATFRTTSVVTGRLSASDPNVLAQPEHGKFAKDFKRGWVADPGHVFGCWDECLVAGTRILKTDLTWVGIETLKAGDSLIGIEEETTNGKERKTLTTRVVATRSKIKHCCTIRLSNGKRITASDEHPWLVKRREHGRHHYKWIKTLDLKVGDQFSKFVEPWSPENSYEAGWLAGFFDGEGCLSANNGTLTLTQNPGPLMERAKTLLRARGYDFHVDSPRTHPSGFGRRQTEVIWMCGVRDCLHFLGTIRPHRLLEKASGLWEGRISLKKKRGKRSPVDSSLVYVKGIEHAGNKEVITLETTSHTFVAEGFHTHNSQVELRGLAHLSQDPVMLAVYRGERRNPDGSLVDLHAALGERIFGIKPKDQDKSKHRLPMKEINFGIPNGMGPRGLMVSLRKVGLDVDEDDAARWLQETLDLYTGVKAYQQTRIEEARRRGFITCLSGRRRYIGGIHSTNARIRESAERLAFSTPIQESAQMIMKQAEASAWKDIICPLQRTGVYIEPVLQVHDSIKLEMADGLQAQVHTMMTQVMTQVPKSFCVPLAVEGEYGVNMADMSPL